MGKHNAYPQEIIDFARQVGPTHTIAETAELITEKFGRQVTYQQVRTLFKNHRIHSAPRKGRPGRSKYPDGMEDFIRGVAPGRSSGEIAGMVNAWYGPGTISAGKVAVYKKNHGITCGRDTRFKKGQVPHNKGTHPPTRGRMAETQFKKGNLPHNTLPIGAEVVRDDGYMQVKVAEPNVWKLKHRIVWEEHNGPIPEGGLVVFRDGNRLNTDISNLALIDKSVSVRLNHMGIRHAEDPRLFDTAALVAKVAAEAGRKKHEHSRSRK